MIDGPFIFVLALVTIVVGIPVICGTIIKLAKIIRGYPDDESHGKSRKHRAQEPTMSESDETRLIQEIHRGLSRLESRIDAIETIVLQSESKRSTTTSTGHE